MKKYFYCSLITVLVTWQIFADDLKTNQWGVVTNNVQMSISLTDRGKEIKSSQPVKLLIRFRNISTNETFLVGRENAIENDPGYSWVVISPSGKDISPKPQIHTGSGGAIPLVPNQFIEFEFNLSRLCKFDELGTYKIVTKKSIWSPENQKLFTVVSTPLYVTVVPEGVLEK